MVELLAAGLTGEQFSYEAKENDNGDGGPPRGGEMVIGLSPALIAGEGWEDHVEAFMDRMTAIEGVRIPGARRHQNRLDTGPRAINSTLVETIRGLI
jgi:delta1-piperideine-2-carboxylate reductase